MIADNLVQTSTFCDPFDQIGQDAIAVLDHIVVVVDAASPKDPRNSERARKFARAAATSLAENLTRRPTFDAIQLTVEELAPRQPSNEALTAAFAAVWQDGDMMRAAVLADCAVVCQFRTGRFETICDQRVKRFDDLLVRRRMELRRAGNDEETVRAAIEAVQVENRYSRNTPGGYWVLSTNASVGNEVLTTAWPKRDVAAILVCSDGFWRAIEPFKIAGSAGDLLCLSQAEGVESVTRRIRRIEQADLEMSRFPRVDPGDDITAILVSDTHGRTEHGESAGVSA